MRWREEQVIDWLFTSGRLVQEPRDFAKAFGERMIEAGAPVSRVRFGCRIIHPLLAAWSVAWSKDMTQGEERQAPHGFEVNDAYINSPLYHVVETGKPFRRRLVDLDEVQDHRLLFELQAEGATDYFAMPVPFSDGSTSNIVLSSHADDGFDDDDLAGFVRLSSYLAPVFEVLAMRRMARNLLNTYVGPRTGARVFNGQIKRGDGEVIRAAVWFSDLRDFTPLTESLPAEALLSLLNAYFEIVTAAVSAQGGEVLRFIGDAMLIVFPVAETVSPEQACAAALDAALDAFNGVGALNMRRRQSGEPEIAFGVGLHVGEVVYGNVGAPDRLDFTVMGPAVNRTARLEGLTKQIGKPLLVSKDFAAMVSAETKSEGLHSMKGVMEQQEVFSLVDYPSSS